MDSKNCVLNPSNFLLASGALNLPSGLACLWLLFPLSEQSKAFSAEMKAQTFLGSKKRS